MQYLFTLIAISQGCLVLGLTLYIFSYYVPKNRGDLGDGLRWHVVSVALSYICLTLCTVRTAAHGFYVWGDVWYWLTTIAYVSGDVSLLFVFRNAVKKRKINELNKNNQ